MKICLLINLCRQNVQMADVGSEHMQRRTVDVLFVKIVDVVSEIRIYIPMLFQ